MSAQYFFNIIKEFLFQRFICKDRKRSSSFTNINRMNDDFLGSEYLDF